MGAVQREPIGPAQSRCRRRRPERALLRWPIGRAGDWCRDVAGLVLGVRWFRFPREVISVAVRWYLRCGLSCRDAGELLAERGVTVGHVTIYRWVQRFTAGFIKAARPCRHAPGNRWFAGGTSRKIAGRRAYLYRAVDQHGQVIDVLLPARRDLAAARPFFTPAMGIGTAPAEVTAGRAPVYPAGPRRAGRLGAAHRRAVRQQPGRDRSRTAEGPAPADARTEAAPLSADFSPPVTPSCRICAAATAAWPPASPATACSAPHSTISRSSSDQQRYQMIML